MEIAGIKISFSKFVVLLMAALFFIPLGGYVLLIMQPSMMSSDVDIYGEDVIPRELSQWNGDTSPNCPDKDIFRNLLDEQHKQADIVWDNAGNKDGFNNRFMETRNIQINRGLEEIMLHNAMDLFDDAMDLFDGKVNVVGVDYYSIRRYAAIDYYEDLYKDCYGEKY